MGIIPEYIQKVNTVTKIWSNNCSPSLIVYFETALPAAGEAILTLVTPTEDDVIRGYLRPKTIRTQGHLTKTRRNGKRSRGIPDTSDLIAKKIPGYERVSSRKVSNGVRNLWRFDGLLQRFLLKLLILDVTINFAYQWSSAILFTEECRDSFRGGAHFGGVGQSYVADGEPRALIANREYWNSAGLSAETVSGIISGMSGPWIAVATMSLARPTPGDTNGAAEIFILDGDNKLLAGDKAGQWQMSFGERGLVTEPFEADGIGQIRPLGVFANAGSIAAKNVQWDIQIILI